jgi:hypothetical protein
MEAKVFRAMTAWLMSLAHAPRRRARERFTDCMIIMIYLWSVINDRPVSWACRAENWPEDLLDRELPSPSVMSRRLRTVGVIQLFERLLCAVSDATAAPVPLVKKLDSKPLCVGAYSKDRDAKRGRIAARLFARGYRLHALFHGRTVRSWILAGMNVHDATVAPQLLARLEGGGGYAVADNAYDTNDCHAAAAAADHQLVAPPRRENRECRIARKNRPERLRALDLLASPLEKCGQVNQFGVALYNCREAAESGFGELTMLGLDHLPAWVRRPRRVALWTAGKIALHLLRDLQRKGVTCSNAKS